LTLILYFVTILLRITHPFLAVPLPLFVCWLFRDPIVMELVTTTGFI